MGQHGDGRRDRFQHVCPLLTHRQSSYRVSIESERGQLLCRLRSQVGIGTSLQNPKYQLSVGPIAGPAALRPESRPPYRILKHGSVDTRRRAVIEHHRDVGAKVALDGHRQFGCEAVRGAVVHRSEVDAVVVHPSGGMSQREHLEPA